MRSSLAMTKQRLIGISLLCFGSMTSFDSIGFATPHLDKGVLQPGVLVFGAEYCGPCKVLCRRLRSLGLEEGLHWRYIDVEDFSANGGAALLDAMNPPPFASLPMLAVLGSDGSRRLELAEELMAFSDAELKSFWTPREENVLLLAELFVRLADMSNMSSLISIQITTGVGVSWLVQGSKHEERTIL
ncbi:unnamed protein product, partial [Durusdinium trenchii]